MRLADEITITVGGEAIELRPCLRFAMRLERREGSFAKLIRDVNEGSLAAAVEIILDHADMPFLENRVFDVLPELRGPLLSYVMACTGLDPDEAPAEGKAKGKAKGKTVTFAEHLTGLYRIGTGWLGWTPADTLDATPAEIMEAYKGRQELLKALFGSGEEKPERPASPDQLDAKLKFIFGARAAAGRRA